MPEHPTYCRKNRNYNCHSRQFHCYCGFRVIELSIPGGLTKHPVCHLFSGKCADPGYLLHKPAFLFSDRERSLFCQSSKHSPPISFSPSGFPGRHGIFPVHKIGHAIFSKVSDDLHFDHNLKFSFVLKIVNTAIYRIWEANKILFSGNKYLCAHEQKR
jgi:hypothetical protein